MTAVAAQARRFDEPEDLAASLLGGEFEYLRLPGQPFAATLRLLKVGDLVIQQAEDGAHITRGTIARGTAGLILPLRLPGGPPRLNGTTLEARHAVLLPGGVEFTVACPERQDWASVALPLDLLESWEELAPGRLLDPGGSAALALDPGGAGRIACLFEAAAAMVDDPRAAAALAGPAEGLARSCMDLLCEVLTDGSRALPRPRAAREACRIVRAADGFLETAIGRPVYRQELCTALGISLRKLHDAFVAVTGIAPQAYLKIRRLALVRRALRAAGREAVLVKSVALAHGFWHLGHFVHDYKALFGETPSATLNAAPIARFG